MAMTHVASPDISDAAFAQFRAHVLAHVGHMLDAARQQRSLIETVQKIGTAARYDGHGRVEDHVYTGHASFAINVEPRGSGYQPDEPVLVKP